jgi:carbon storage regulator CsrA
MLVLTRKVGERIIIGENVMIEVRRVAGNRVTLALDAPRKVRILRGELERAAREFDSPVEDAETPCVLTPGHAMQGLPPHVVPQDTMT